MNSERNSISDARYRAVVVFAGIWIAIGIVFHLGAIPYHLVGVGLMLLFQRFIARRPLCKLWVRGAATFQCYRAVQMLALVLAALACAALVFRPDRLAPGTVGWMFPFVILAVLPAAFALRHTTLAGVRAHY